jgi:hypothetical protein
MLSVGNGHHITSTYPRMTLPRDHEKSKRSWKRISKRAKRPKRPLSSITQLHAHGHERRSIQRINLHLRSITFRSSRRFNSFI